MAKNEKTSKDIASIAARGLKDPKSLSKKEIQKISAAVLTQAPDKPKAPKPAKPKPAAKPKADPIPKAVVKPKATKHKAKQQ